jgi:hypothetical protein
MESTVQDEGRRARTVLVGAGERQREETDEERGRSIWAMISALDRFSEARGAVIAA